MSRTLVAIAANALLVASITSGARAQASPGAFDGWLGEFNHASRQLMALAEATPAEKFAWRPAEGVRSTAEVYMHVAIGNYRLLAFTGATPAVDPAKQHQQLETSVTEKADVLKFLGESFDAVRAGYPSIDGQKTVQVFGRKATVDAVLLRLLVHNHEHMGQAIAYARMSGIAPPWS
jgi:uncharacterized damage-inducible protein DinB